MFFNVLRMECDKVFRRRLPWIGMIIVAATFLFYFGILFEGSGNKVPFAQTIFVWPAGVISGHFMVISSLPIASMGIFLSIVVTGGVTAQEYSWHSLQLWLCQGVPRAVLFAAKVTVSFMTILLITLGATLTGIVTSLIAAIQLHHGISLGQIDVFQLFISWLRVSYSVLPYTMLAFMLSILIRSPFAAITVGLLSAAIVEMLMLPLERLGPIVKRIWSFFPMPLGLSVNQANFAAARLSAPPKGIYGTIPLHSPGTAALFIGLYSLVCIGIAYWSFSRQNLSR